MDGDWIRNPMEGLDEQERCWDCEGKLLLRLIQKGFQTARTTTSQIPALRRLIGKSRNTILK